MTGMFAQALAFRRWFAAGLCVVGPLALLGGSGLWTWAPSSVGSHHENADQITVSDRAITSAPIALTAELNSTVVASNELEAESASSAEPIDPTVAAIVEAKSLVAIGRERYDSVADYRCVFTKRERLKNGRVVGPQVMEMKVRTQPQSVYFKFVKPHGGREAIWVDGEYGGKMLVHEGGLGKLLAGTLHIDPTSSMAMDENRHPITDAGIGFLLDELATRWEEEMLPGVMEVEIARNAQVGERACTMVEARHPDFSTDFLYHKVKVYFDQEHGLPIRFEAYDWPNSKGKIELVEEYNYVDLELNVGLGSDDFNPRNTSYSFGRF